MTATNAMRPLHRRDQGRTSLKGFLRGPRREKFYLLVPVVAAALWIGGFIGVDPRDMGTLGLLTFFTPLTVFALALLLGGFLLALYRARPEWVLATYITTYILLIHGTPVLMYGTLRYSWAYKHVGIVDYIQRHGAVDPLIDVGQIYHNWPGFFAGSALMTEFSGQADALLIASWAPVVFNLINVLVIRFLFRGLTRKRSLIWLGVLFFVLINWVGQDYFSPQAIGFILYLAMVGLMLRSIPTRAMIGPFVVMVATVSISHQITPMMILLAVLALVALRRTWGWYLPLLALAIVGTWAFTGAWNYTSINLLDLISEFGNVADNADQTLEKSSSSKGFDLLVVWGGRSTVIIAVLVSFFGVLGEWLRRSQQQRIRAFMHPRYLVEWQAGAGAGPTTTAVVLMLLPSVLVLTTGFGGEVLFRAFLFSSPLIAFLAAKACLANKDHNHSWRSKLMTVVVVTMIAPGFLLGYYGKEQQNYFTQSEVEVSRWLYTHAEPGSLLVEGSSNYPTKFIDYEKFTYVPIDREPDESIREILADPVGKMTDWLSNPKYSEGYILISRGQKMAVDSGGSMSPGSLERIEELLERSGNFEVLFEGRDATVFVLSEEGQNQ